jgi:hypothetical protein
MLMRAVGIGFVLLVAGCGRSGMSLNPTFEEKAHAIPVVRDQEAPRTTRLAFGSTRVENLVFSSETSELSFELTYARERFTTACESRLRFDAASLERSALACVITTSKGDSFELEVEGREGAQGRILRSLDRGAGPLFELDGRGGSASELAGFSVRRGGAEVAAVELPHAVSEPNAWLTGALLDEEKGAVLAAFAAITSVRWPGDAPLRTAR